MTPPYRAVILAGERPGGSALARTLALPATVLVEVAGRTALERVIDSVEGANSVTGALLCGPQLDVLAFAPGVLNAMEAGDIDWMAPEPGPSASALKAAQSLGHFPVLITTGDHALLTAGLVDRFCQRAAGAGGDIVAALAPYERVRSAYPGSRRTVLRFRDGAFCSCNLFAVLNPPGLKALAFWGEVEALRKRPWKIARRLGIGSLVRYLLRRMTLAEALERLSRACGCRVATVRLEDARAAVDIDSPEDRELAERILGVDAAGSERA